MSRIGDLMKSLRSGTGPVDAAAKALLKGGRSDKPTAAEVQELAALLNSPEVADRFSPEVRADLEAMLTGQAPGLEHTVPELLPDLERVSDAAELPERFVADFHLVKEQLLDPPGYSAQDKAGRLFEFFSAYAQRFVTLAQGGPSKEAAARFAQVLGELGFAQVRDAHSHLDGVKLGRELLLAKSERDFVRKASAVELVADAKAVFGEPVRRGVVELPAPLAPAAKPSLDLGESGKLLERRPELERVPGRPDLLRVQPLAAELGRPIVQAADRRAVGPEATGEPPRTFRKLGPNLLWNWLHRFRDVGAAEEETAQAQEAWDKLAFAALLILGGLSLLAVILVSL